MLAGPSKNWLLPSSYKSKSWLLGNASCEFVHCCAYSISHTNFLLQVSDPKCYPIDVKPMEVNVLANPPLSCLQKASQTPVVTAQEHIQMGGPNGQPSFPYGFYPLLFALGQWYQPPPTAGSAMFGPYGIQVSNELGSTDSSHLHNVIAESTDGHWCAGTTSNSTYGHMS